MKLKVILTGATGMVGEGVLHECLQHDDVEQVLVVGRRPCGITHAKLKEIVHPDLYDLSAIENQLTGYNACFFCLGTTSLGKKEPEFYKVTYELTMSFGKTLSKQNPDMTLLLYFWSRNRQYGKRKNDVGKGKRQNRK